MHTVRGSASTRNLITVLAATLFAGAAAAAPDKDVNVVNTPDVNVVNTPGVTVTNTPLVGIDPSRNQVQVLANEPFQRTASVSIPISQSSWSWNVLVPLDRRLVVEYLSGSFSKLISAVTDIDGHGLRATVTTSVAGNVVSHVAPITGFYVGGKSWFAVAQPLKLYADAGTTLTVKIENLYSPGYTYDGFMSISGQLQKAP